jgi:prevent-host-death family protein
MTRRIPIAAARKNLAELVASSAKGERIKLTRYNRSLVAVIPKRDLKELERCEEGGGPANRGRRRARRPGQR